MLKLITTLGAVAVTAICAFHGPAVVSAGQTLLAAEQTAPAPAQPGATKMQDMSKMHEQMQADMAASDAKLDQLVAGMNAAAGEAKVAAIAEVVNELVRQQKAMHAHMAMMARHMGEGMGRRPPMKK